MGANPYNTNVELSRSSSRARLDGVLRIGQRPVDYAPGREALQALLAFSALHDQIRRRRARQARQNGFPPAEVWAGDDFVFDEVLQLVTERGLAMTGAEGVALALSEDGQVLCRASAGLLGPGLGTRLNPNSGFSGACFRTALVIRCDDAFKDPRVDRDACERIGVRSMVAIPLVTDQGVIGLLEGFCSEPHGFNDSDVRSLSLLAELVLAALKPEQDLPLEEIPTQVNAPEARQPRAPSAAPQAEVQTPAALPSFESLREALTPVTEDNSKVQAQELTEAPVEKQESTKAPERNIELPEAQLLFAQYESQQSGSRTGKRIAIVLLIVILVLGLAAAGWWWRGHHRFPFQALAQKQQETASAVTPASLSQAPPAPTVTVQKDASLPQITGVRHWSSDDSTTVAIDLQDQVQYEAHRLTDPERIYFDLHDTSLATGLPANIEVGDSLLVRIRVAQPTPGVTRVVMETKNSPNYSVSLEPNPYRLLVEIRSIGAKPKNAANIDLFAPMHRELPGQVAMGKQEKKQSAVVAKSGVWLAPPAENQRLSARAPKFRIVLDAGHGGWDMGTVGRRGLLEKNLVLDIVARLGNLVEKRLGGEVIYTRHDDTYISLESRTDLANRSQADIFLSVHANYSDLPSARGVETYYTNTFSSEHARPPGVRETDVNWANVDVREKAQESRHFAAAVQQELYKALSGKDHALRNRGVREASYVVLTGTTMPAILAEVSFVSSPTDEKSLQSASYRQRIAEALYKGLADYASALHRVNLASTVARPSGQ